MDVVKRLELQERINDGTATVEDYRLYGELLDEEVSLMKESVESESVYKSKLEESDLEIAKLEERYKFLRRTFNQAKAKRSDGDTSIDSLRTRLQKLKVETKEKQQEVERLKKEIDEFITEAYENDPVLKDQLGDNFDREKRRYEELMADLRSRSRGNAKELRSNYEKLKKEVEELQKIGNSYRMKIQSARAGGSLKRPKGVASSFLTDTIRRRERSKRRHYTLDMLKKKDFVKNQFEPFLIREGQVSFLMFYKAFREYDNAFSPPAEARKPLKGPFNQRREAELRRICARFLLPGRPTSIPLPAAEAKRIKGQLDYLLVAGYILKKERGDKNPSIYEEWVELENMMREAFDRTCDKLKALLDNFSLQKERMEISPDLPEPVVPDGAAALNDVYSNFHTDVPQATVLVSKLLQSLMSMIQKSVGADLEGHALDYIPSSVHFRNPPNVSVIRLDTLPRVKFYREFPKFLEEAALLKLLDDESLVNLSREQGATFYVNLFNLISLHVLIMYPTEMKNMYVETDPEKRQRIVRNLWKNGYIVAGKFCSLRWIFESGLNLAADPMIADVQPPSSAQPTTDTGKKSSGKRKFPTDVRFSLFFPGVFTDHVKVYEHDLTFAFVENILQFLKRNVRIIDDNKVLLPDILGRIISAVRVKEWLLGWMDLPESPVIEYYDWCSSNNFQVVLFR